MGTDIHLYTERRVDGVWVTCDKWTNDPNYPEEGLRVAYDDMPFHDRNYDLFAMLADVRNGRDFAGCVTGAGFVPIHPPRGVPEDARPEYLALGKDHTPSWATLAELLAYDWTQKSTKSGIVDLRGLARWKINGRPEGWSGGISGPGIRVFDAQEALLRVEAVLKRQQKQDWYQLYHLPGTDFSIDEGAYKPAQKALVEAIATELGCPRPHFQVNWEVQYSKAAGNFWTYEIPRLLRLGKPEDVRICYFFDN